MYSKAFLYMYFKIYKRIDELHSLSGTFTNDKLKISEKQIFVTSVEITMFKRVIKEDEEIYKMFYEVIYEWALRGKKTG